MILAFALAAAVLFGSGAYLLLKRDLIRMVAGIMLISQCAVVTIIAAALSRGGAAIAVAPGDAVSDPLPQALALTALVIGLATVALLLALVHRAVVVFRTAEQDELAATEAEHEAGLERQRQADREETETHPDETRPDDIRPEDERRAGRERGR
ncbi:NADH-quinone oxidoreductase subunit K [Saccharothrix texasensis]|uniref:Multisubunit sodium/proton antiporter MrpC subunit n=1 Tax=Saccharothrix texasensis TaxID=103734 RepID=A0A3N1HHV7_9PSEU|nr:NADH-quinone oxidoreductase subunit K [Saccharothrix texasensis]ROP42044.1 multisubunit sodium/proton antiporter MrpC subunit [Saccharothrix texasensis]